MVNDEVLHNCSCVSVVTMSSIHRGRDSIVVDLLFCILICLRIAEMKNTSIH